MIIPEDISEQCAILAYPDRETVKIDTLIGKTKEAIERLAEYRMALISAAMTGKINVRDVVRGNVGRNWSY